MIVFLPGGGISVINCILNPDWVIGEMMIMVLAYNRATSA